MKTLTSLSLLGTVLLVLLSPTGVVGAAEPALTSPAARDQFLREFKRTALNTTPGDAMMLRILVQTSKAKRGVEVGTATGYGALNMGIAFERNGGHLTTIDIDAQMVQAARANVATLGLQKTVTVIEGDALKVLPTLEGEVDFVFIDALKRDYLKYYQLLRPRLKPGALVVADNVIRSETEMKDFLDLMEQDPNYERVIIRASMEKNDGMAIYYKIR
jgi:predicted O-methyltransferase YrrM